MDKAKLTRLIRCYFSEPTRKLTVSAGETIITQNTHNERLYYVWSGEVEGYVTDHESGRKTKIFLGTEGAFLGVQSFFSDTLIASSTVVAKTDVELAWIDDRTSAIEPEYYGALPVQFTPVIVSELSRRQMRAMEEAVAKEEALQKLHLAEQMTTLGQLAAGIAHELNNALGVLSSKTERMHTIISDLMKELYPEASTLMEQGFLQGQSASSSEIRIRARELEKALNIPKSFAKPLARAVPQGEVPALFLERPEEALRCWEVGRDLHDMRLAARHSIGIVKSVKQLGRADSDTEEWLDVNESVNKAVALLQSDLRRVSVHMSPANLPKFRGSSTELVQIWANIIKNACDAMEKTPEPIIDITTRFSNKRILVTIANNGPEIEQSIRRKIFQPNFTTKKGGLSFGLGLGLSIVRRIISGYGGSIAVKSDAEKTIFRIKLPVEEYYGEVKPDLC